jgi:sugar phosphate isomerase/epimerase
MDRRDMLIGVGAAAAAAALRSAGAAPAPAGLPKPCLFSKMVHGHKVAELPGVLQPLGIAALDLTCRPEGHVAPERAADDLPKAVELLRGAGIAVPMITTGLTDPKQGNAEAILATAGQLNIPFAKLGYWQYGRTIDPARTLADVKAKLTDLVVLAAQHKVRLGLHNHSGNYVGAPVWDYHQLMSDLDPRWLGSYFDLGHATVEGGLGGWRINLSLMRPRLFMVAVKDFKPAGEPGKGYNPAWGPLGQGAVHWAEAFRTLKQTGFTGPISMHVEYGAEGDLTNISRDWAWLQQALKAAELG